MAKFGWKSFIGGFLLGTCGLELLKTETADKVYTYTTAGALIAKDWVMKQVEFDTAKSQVVLADAKEIQERYMASKAAANFEETVRGTDE